MILALSGGVGGARLASGLAALLPPERLTVVVNTGDDFEHLGLYICPDLDTVMYTLAGLADPERGWGVAGESWNFMDSLRRLGAPDWFALGDRDLATHVQRSLHLGEGASLSQVTRELCRVLEVGPVLLPMSELPAPTRVESSEGMLSFQEYFVREHCVPRVLRLHYPEGVVPQPQFMELLAGEATEAVVLCPSNPFLSIDPILRLQGVRDALRQGTAPVVAVSPIVGGRALRGPAAKMMAELEMPQSAAAVAEYYAELLDGFVLDEEDRALVPQLEALGLAVLATQTVMGGEDERRALAREVLDFAVGLRD